MTNANPVAMLRALIVYAVCVPLAIVVGYMITNPLDYQSIGFIGVLGAVMVFPLLMKWHYELLIFSIGLPATLFFLPGRPSMFVAMVVISLTISVIERILNRNQPFVPSTAVRWPLLALLAVVFFTAKLTGGFGLRSMGSDVYGGRKYVIMIVGILSFFAIAARPIPKNRLKFYLGLYFSSCLFTVLGDVYPFVPAPLHFIYLIFPPSVVSMGNFTDKWQIGVTRLGGIAGSAGAALCWMLARHGFRDSLLTGRIWRPVSFGVLFLLILLGGFRSSIICMGLILGVIFYLEKLHRSSLMLIVILGGFMGATLMVPLAPHLPYTFQRALAFLPLNISAQARLDAQGSTDWRLQMWSALLPQVPQYLLLGKGFAFTPETFNESMGADATFQHSIDAAQDPLALSSDFHSGPLSVVISFGIWGVLGWLWYWGAGVFVVWRNYKYGDPELRHINMFLFASFVSKVFSFLFIFGGIVDDVGGFASIIGFSVALNHGVKRPKPLSRVNPLFAKPRVPFPVQPALQP